MIADCIFYHVYKEAVFEEFRPGWFGPDEIADAPSVKTLEYRDVYVPKYPQLLTMMELNWPCLKRKYE